MLLVLSTLHHKAALQLCWYLYIIISVDTENILYHITWTLNIHSVCWYLKQQGCFALAQHLHLKALANALHNLSWYILTYQ